MILVQNLMHLITTSALLPIVLHLKLVHHSVSIKPPLGVEMDHLFEAHHSFITARP
jgi:hypothetical protein